MGRTVGNKDYMLMYRGEAGCTMRYEPVCYCCCYLLYTYATPLERTVIYKCAIRVLIYCGMHLSFPCPGDIPLPQKQKQKIHIANK